ncbi:hypothetical protein V6N13_030118 [Hibiscus sabdariffa]
MALVAFPLTVTSAYSNPVASIFGVDWIPLSCCKDPMCAPSWQLSSSLLSWCLARSELRACLCGHSRTQWSPSQIKHLLDEGFLEFRESVAFALPFHGDDSLCLSGLSSR